MRWAWWGVGAGALGLLANLVSAGPASDESAGVAVVRELSRARFHVGVAAGMIAVGCLLLSATGWHRWASRSSRSELEVLAVAPSLAASAAALLVGYGVKGGLAEYLRGGINDDNFTDQGLYVLYIVNDTAPWFGWWGVVVAAGLVGWAALVHRLLPLWLGVLSALVLAVPIAVMALTGAVAIAGVVGPAWLVVVSLSVAVRGLRPPDARTA